MPIQVSTREHSDGTPGRYAGQYRLVEFLRLERDFAAVAYAYSGLGRWLERQAALQDELDQLGAD